MSDEEFSNKLKDWVFRQRPVKNIPKEEQETKAQTLTEIIHNEVFQKYQVTKINFNVTDEGEKLFDNIYYQGESTTLNIIGLTSSDDYKYSPCLPLLPDEILYGIKYIRIKDVVLSSNFIKHLQLIKGYHQEKLVDEVKASRKHYPGNMMPLTIIFDNCQLAV